MAADRYLVQIQDADGFWCNAAEYDSKPKSMKELMARHRETANAAGSLRVVRVLPGGARESVMQVSLVSKL